MGIGPRRSEQGGVILNPEVQDVTTGYKVVQYLKENRMEMMVITLLLYTLGLLDKAQAHVMGVCA